MRREGIEAELASLEDLAALVLVQLDPRRESRKMTVEIDAPAIASGSISAVSESG